MAPGPDDLPDDPARLKEIIAAQQKTIASKDKIIAKHETALERLKAALVWFQQRMFGRSSEKVPASVVEKILESCAELFGEDFTEGTVPAPDPAGEDEGERAGEEGPEDEAASGDDDDGRGEPDEEGGEEDVVVVASHERRRRGGRRDATVGLPRVVWEHDLPEEERLCPGCGDPMEKIGEEETKLLDFVAPLFYALVHSRSKYVCKKSGCQDEVSPVTAPVPSTPLYKSVPGPGLLAHLVTSKYRDHLPLERQRKIYKRHGVEIAVATMVRWIAKSAEFLEPLYELLVEQVLASDIIQTDDTKITVLRPAPPGKARPPEARDPPKKARIWVYRGDPEHPYVVFDATDDWSKEGPGRFLAGFEGILQADAYGGYDHLHETGKVIEAGCHAHARRGFHKARSVDKRAHKALDFFRRLYKVEKKAKKRKLDPDARLELRREQSAPVMEAFREWLDAVEPQVLPRGPMGEAIGYVRNQWEALELFLKDGRVELDNNASERDLRQVVVGRNNWKFAGSDAGARRAAILYSVIASAVRNGVEPLAYLRNVFAELPGTPRSRPISRELLEPFLPDRWAKDAKEQDALFAHVGPKLLRALSASLEDIASSR